MVAGLLVVYLTSFGPESPVVAQEPFGQDSHFVVWALAEGVPYPWNPQNHLLYHAAVETGWRGWQALAGGGSESAFRYLRVFCALVGLAFLVGLRRFLCERGVGTAARAALLALAGLSAAAWFHFAVPESHALVLPAVVLYGLALLRLRGDGPRSPADRLLFVGSLLWCGWARVELWRMAVVSLLLLVLPAARRHRRTLAADLAAVALVGALGSAALAVGTLDRPLAEAWLAPFERGDRPDLAARLARADNLSPANLAGIARAGAVYGFVMPVGPRGFAAPLADFGPHPASWPVLLGLVALLGFALWRGAIRLRQGDPLAWLLLAQALAAWLLYTWFNPFEPFLWSAQLWVLGVLAVADASGDAGARAGLGLGLLAAAVAAHNAVHLWARFG